MKRNLNNLLLFLVLSGLWSCTSSEGPFKVVYDDYGSVLIGKSKQGQRCGNWVEIDSMGTVLSIFKYQACNAAELSDAYSIRLFAYWGEELFTEYHSAGVLDSVEFPCKEHTVIKEGDERFDEYAEKLKEWRKAETQEP